MHQPPLFKNGTKAYPSGWKHTTGLQFWLYQFAKQHKQNPLLNFFHFCSNIHHLLQVYQMWNWS